MTSWHQKTRDIKRFCRLHTLQQVYSQSYNISNTLLGQCLLSCLDTAGCSSVNYHGSGSANGDGAVCEMIETGNTVYYTPLATTDIIHYTVYDCPTIESFFSIE